LCYFIRSMNITHAVIVMPESRHERKMRKLKNIFISSIFVLILSGISIWILHKIFPALATESTPFVVDVAMSMAISFAFFSTMTAVISWKMARKINPL
jgi:Kef-type K+ transport system membrane component KefB